MDLLNALFLKKYDFSQFEKVIEFTNDENTIISFEFADLYPDTKLSIYSNKNTIEKIKEKYSNDNRVEFLDASQGIPSGNKTFIAKFITDYCDVDSLHGFMLNLFNSTEEYARLITFEKGLFIKEMKEEINIKNINDIGYIYSEAGFVITNIIKLENELFLLEALRK